MMTLFSSVERVSEKPEINSGFLLYRARAKGDLQVVLRLLQNKDPRATRLHSGASRNRLHLFEQEWMC